MLLQRRSGWNAAPEQFLHGLNKFHHGDGFGYIGFGSGSADAVFVAFPCVSGNGHDRDGGERRVLFQSLDQFQAANMRRSEERRVGKEGVRTCRFRWAPLHYKKKQKITTMRDLI